MSVIFDAFLCILSIEVVLIKQFIEKLVLNWHLLLTWEKSHISISVFHLQRPSVISNVVDGKSSLWISIKDSSNEVFALSAQELGKSILGSHDLLVQIGGLWILERQVTAHHGIKHNATAPNISFEPMIPFSGDHFGCCITW